MNSIAVQNAQRFVEVTENASHSFAHSIASVEMTIFLQRAGILQAVVLAVAGTSLAAPNGFPASGNGLWYRTPGTSWVEEFLPIGNGYLAGENNGSIVRRFSTHTITAMTPGGTSEEVTQLNIESLWTGGLWQDPVCSRRKF